MHASLVTKRMMTINSLMKSGPLAGKALGFGLPCDRVVRVLDSVTISTTGTNWLNNTISFSVAPRHIAVVLKSVNVELPPPLVSVQVHNIEDNLRGFLRDIDVEIRSGTFVARVVLISSSAGAARTQRVISAILW